MPSSSRAAWFELLVWLAIGITAFALTFQFSAEQGTYKWGAASWPRAIILLLIVFAGIQFLLQKHNRNPDAQQSETTTSSTTEKIQLLATFALPLIYLFLLPRTGFYLTTPLFLAAFLFVLGERRWHILILVPLIIFAFINILFTKLFYVALPTGSWPGFYDFSNWFIVLIR